MGLLKGFPRQGSLARDDLVLWVCTTSMTFFARCCMFGIRCVASVFSFFMFDLPATGLGYLVEEARAPFHALFAALRQLHRCAERLLHRSTTQTPSGNFVNINGCCLVVDDVSPPATAVQRVLHGLRHCVFVSAWGFRGAVWSLREHLWSSSLVIACPGVPLPRISLPRFTGNPNDWSSWSAAAEAYFRMAGFPVNHTIPTIKLRKIRTVERWCMVIWRHDHDDLYGVRYAHDVNTLNWPCRLGDPTAAGYVKLKKAAAKKAAAMLLVNKKITENDARIWYELQMAVLGSGDASVIIRSVKSKSGHEAWATLYKQYAKTRTGDVTVLQKQLRDAQIYDGQNGMEEGDDILDFIVKLDALHTSVFDSCTDDAHRDSIPELTDSSMKKVLRMAVPNSLNTLLSGYSSQNPTATYHDMCEHLREHANMQANRAILRNEHRTSHKKRAAGAAATGNSNGNGGGKGGGANGANATRAERTDGSTDGPSTDKECFHCKTVGHFSRYCPKHDKDRRINMQVAHKRRLANNNTGSGRGKGGKDGKGGRANSGNGDSGIAKWQKDVNKSIGALAKSVKASLKRPRAAAAAPANNDSDSDSGDGYKFPTDVERFLQGVGGAAIDGTPRKARSRKTKRVSSRNTSDTVTNIQIRKKKKLATVCTQASHTMGAKHFFTRRLGWALTILVCLTILVFLVVNRFSGIFGIGLILLAALALCSERQRLFALRPCFPALQRTTTSFQHTAPHQRISTCPACGWLLNDCDCWLSSSDDDDDDAGCAPAATATHHGHQPGNQADYTNARGCHRHSKGSFDDRRCSYIPKITDISAKIIALGRRLHADDPDCCIIDSGAAIMAFHNKKYAVEGTLRPACGEAIAGATGNAKIDEIGSAAFEFVDSVDGVTGGCHAVKTGPTSWFGSALGFNLASIKVMTGLGYGFTFNDPPGSEPRMTHHDSGTSIAIREVDGIYVARMRLVGSQPAASAGNVPPSKRSIFAAALTGDYFWNQKIALEEHNAALACSAAASIVQEATSATSREATPTTSGSLGERPLGKRKRSTSSRMSVKTAATVLLLTVLTCAAVPARVLHHRMGHGFSGWGTAIAEGNVTGVQVTGRFKAPCDDCTNSKLARDMNSAGDLQSFGTYSVLPDNPNCTKPAEKIGLDGVGPFECDAIGGFKGFFTFACYRTMAIWVDLYRRPREFYTIYKGFANMIKSKYRSTIRLIVTDQHPLWNTTNSEWKKVLQDHDSPDVKYSSTYTPQQNQTAERENRTVLDCSRTMLIASGLHKRYWGHAVLYACDVLLCTPRRRLNNKTPYEMLYGRAPDISRFRTFGCKTWAWVPKAKRQKWDARSKQGIFVGFSKSAPAYLVYIESEGKTMETPFCLFDESKFGGSAPAPVEAYFGETGARGDHDRAQLLPEGDSPTWASPPSPPPTTSPPTDRASKRRKTKKASAAQPPAPAYRNDVGPEFDPTKFGEWGYKDNDSAAATRSTLVDNDQEYEAISSDEDDSPSPAPETENNNQPRNARLRKQQRVNYTMASIASGSTYPSINAAPRADKELHKLPDTWRRHYDKSSTKPGFATVIMCWIAAATSLQSEVGIMSEECYTSPGLLASKKTRAATYDQPTWAQAKTRDDCPQWMTAWDCEKTAMCRLGVLKECDAPDNESIAGSTLVCKIKRLWNGAIDKYRVRWVMQGFSQVFGFNYFDTASPVVQAAVVRIMTAIMTVTGCVGRQCDVSVAFLRAKLDVKLWMWPPRGTPPLPRNPVTGKQRCYEVSQAIYGCKQAAYCWNKHLSQLQFIDNGYTQCPYDSCLWYKRPGMKFCICASYVDDQFYISNWDAEITAFEKSFTDNFEVTKFEDITWFLGWHFERDLVKGTTYVSQKQFVLDALQRFGLQDCHPRKQPCPTDHVFEEVDPEDAFSAADQKLYMEKVGTLNYLSTSSRADIAWTTSKLGMYMQRASPAQMAIADHCFQYLKGTAGQGLLFKKSAGLEPECYSDASHGDPGKCGGNGRRRSQSGCVVTIGGAFAIYFSRTQKNVALSTAEAEYVALSQAVQEVIWTRRVLTFLGFPPKDAATVYEDNEAAQALASKELMTKRSRFVDCRFHYVREQVREGEIKVVRCGTADMRADLFTKGLPTDTIQKHWNGLRGQDRDGGIAKSKTRTVALGVIQLPGLDYL